MATAAQLWQDFVQPSSRSGSIYIREGMFAASHQPIVPLPPSNLPFHAGMLEEPKLFQHPPPPLPSFAFLSESPAAWQQCGLPVWVVGAECQAKALTKEGHSYSYDSTAHTRHLRVCVCASVHVCEVHLKRLPSAQTQQEPLGSEVGRRCRGERGKQPPPNTHTLTHTPRPRRVSSRGWKRSG